MNTKKIVISIAELKRAIDYIEKTRTNVNDSTTAVFTYDGFLRTPEEVSFFDIAGDRNE